MSETIGQQLKRAREEHNLTIEKVVEATHLRARHIELMETDDFESLPSPVQARAFLRIYATYLGLSLDDVISRQRAGIVTPAAAPPQPEPAPARAKKQKAQPAPPAAPEAEPPANAETPNTEKPPTLKNRVRELLARQRQALPQRERPPQPDQPSEATELEAEEAAPPEPISLVSEDKDAATPDQPASAKPAARKSQEIFSEIGEALRQRREALSLTLDEIEQHTRVRQHYLRALEAGEFDHLPSSVQTRGMLNNYARFLDMDVDAVLLQFAEGLQIQRLERQPHPAAGSPKPATRTSREASLPTGLRRFLSMDILVGGGLTVLLLAFAAWGTSRIVGLRAASTPQPTALSISQLLANTPEGADATQLPEGEGEVTATLPQANETAAATVPAAGEGAVQVVIVAHESAWVRITVDGKKQFEGRVSPGNAYPYGGNTQIEVLTGNGAALNVLYNQSDLGVMGAFGEVVDRIYTVDAILSPTATATLTPTITPIPSQTPRPSATPRPSPTTRGEQ